MKKVGLITFHSTNNYGAALQCYALQQALNNIGADAKVIDYTAAMLERPFGITALKEKGVIRYILGVFYYFLRSFRNKKFNNFRNLIKKTPKVKKSELVDLNNVFDVFITGSDQVWNGTITSYDDAYYLGFVREQKKKNSYAASFGMNRIPDDKTEQYIKLLRDFNTYFVREQNGVQIIKELLDKDAFQTIDPTLLIKKSEWEDVAIDPEITGKYIFVYQISPSDIIPKVVKKLRQITGYRIVAIPFLLGKQSVRYKAILNAGPAEWIGYIKNAEYIVTDSFHGTAFSTLFNKCFFSCVSENESRIASFLKMVKLESRLLSSASILENIATIDFTESNRIIEMERGRGVEILKDMINI